MRQYKSIICVWTILLAVIASTWSLNAQEKASDKSLIKKISNAGTYWYQHYSWLDKLTFEPMLLTRIRLTLLVESELEKASFRSVALSIEKKIYDRPDLFHTNSNFHLIFLDKNKNLINEKTLKNYPRLRPYFQGIKYTHIDEGIGDRFRVFSKQSGPNTIVIFYPLPDPSLYRLVGGFLSCLLILLITFLIIKPLYKAIRLGLMRKKSDHDKKRMKQQALIS